MNGKGPPYIQDTISYQPFQHLQATVPSPTWEAGPWDSCHSVPRNHLGPLRVRSKNPEKSPVHIAKKKLLGIQLCANLILPCKKHTCPISWGICSVCRHQIPLEWRSKLLRKREHAQHCLLADLGRLPTVKVVGERRNPTLGVKFEKTSSHVDFSVKNNKKHNKETKKG